MKNCQALNDYLEQFRQNVLKSREVDYAVQVVIQRLNRADDNYRSYGADDIVRRFGTVTFAMS